LIIVPLTELDKFVDKLKFDPLQLTTGNALETGSSALFISFLPV
jgi:hypothetical protein